jgi:hypothetical protein
VTEPAGPLEFTGERFTPECVREIWYEHWHRYVFAMPLCRDRRVLDAACGEGYGSNLIARVAREVVGVDIAEAAIAHARQRYGKQERVCFEQGDAAALAFPAQSFDVVLSFETLEHLSAQQELVAGFARVLTDAGVLLISSPDKRTYSEIAGFRNEFHVRELYREELLDLLRAHFPHVRLYAQKLLFQSCLWALDGQGAGSTMATAAADGTIVQGMPDHLPLYYVAACSRQPLPDALPATSWFGDKEESVYSHYNGEVRRNMRAGARIAELEAELDRLRQTVPDRAPSRWLRWLRR